MPWYFFDKPCVHYSVDSMVKVSILSVSFGQIVDTKGPVISFMCGYVGSAVVAAYSRVLVFCVEHGMNCATICGHANLAVNRTLN